MGDIARMNDKGWLHGKSLDLVDRFLERAQGVGVGWLVSNPAWLSLICRKVSPLGSAAVASLQSITKP
jgi:hypothetical protein